MVRYKRNAASHYSNFFKEYAINFKLFFQPELYKKDLVRQASTESSAGPEMEYCGKLHFALRYDRDVEGLVVKVNIFVALIKSN